MLHVEMCHSFVHCAPISDISCWTKLSLPCPV